MGQGVMMPVLPVLARSAGLGAIELGMVTAAAALARISTNVRNSPCTRTAQEECRHYTVTIQSWYTCCVCVRVEMHVYTHACAHLYTHICTHVCMH